MLKCSFKNGRFLFFDHPVRNNKKRTGKQSICTSFVIIFLYMIHLGQNSTLNKMVTCICMSIQMNIGGYMKRTLVRTVTLWMYFCIEQSTLMMHHIFINKPKISHKSFTIYVSSSV